MRASEASPVACDIDFGVEYLWLGVLGVVVIITVASEPGSRAEEPGPGELMDTDYILLQRNRPRYSNSTKNFKWPKNREDSSDLDENLTESIAAMKTFISKNFVAAGLQKNCFKKFRRASRCLNINR